jgi:chromosome partitioning protein
MSITAFLNLKGGCGKSTSAVHLCRYFLGNGYHVALVDTDAQATSSTWTSNLDEGIPRPTIVRLTEPDPILDAIPEIASKHDQVVIDGAGGLAEVQRAIMLLANLVLIPVQPSVPDIAASSEAVKAVGRARQIRGGEPKAFTFLTRVLPKTVLLREARDVLNQMKDVPLLKSEIHQRQAVADCMGQNVTLFDMKGNRGATEVSNQYRELFMEVGYGKS